MVFGFKEVDADLSFNFDDFFICWSVDFAINIPDLE